MSAAGPAVPDLVCSSYQWNGTQKREVYSLSRRMDDGRMVAVDQ